MTENESIVNLLEINIQKLMLVYGELKKENQLLHNEIESLKGSIQAKDTEFKDLKTRFESLKLAKLLVPNSDDQHEAKLKVNRIVREIDKCIALLNK
jgi:ABC-type phosphate transport system auxiliary subunit